MAQDFEKLNIQWFPGHMTKAQRMIEEHMKQVDAVCEILDARIPMASRNPDIDRLAGEKPRIVVLNRTDLADPKATARWRAAFQRQGMTVLETDSRSGKGVNGFAGAVRTALHDKIEAYAAKGQVGRPTCPLAAYASILSCSAVRTAPAKPLTPLPLRLSVSSTVMPCR